MLFKRITYEKELGTVVKNCSALCALRLFEQEFGKLFLHVAARKNDESSAKVQEYRGKKKRKKRERFIRLERQMKE